MRVRPSRRSRHLACHGWRRRLARGGSILAVLSAVLPATAAAHAGQPLAPHDLLFAWSRDPGVVVPLLLIAVLYARGRLDGRRTTLGRAVGARLRSREARRQDHLAIAAWIALALALASPIHALGEALFAAHMVQHLLLMGVAAPLLVLSRPLPVVLRGLPASLRHRAPRFIRSRVVHRAMHPRPMEAWLVHAIVVWAWHTPGLYGASVTIEWVHALQHASFLAAALAFWATVLPGRADAPGIAVLSLFTTALHTGVLGALITLLREPRFTPYLDSAPRWGLTPLEDQQLAGLVMWIPGGILYLLAALAAALAMVRERQTAMEGR